jgi:hypothetical protein
MATCHNLISIEKELNKLTEFLKETDSIMIRSIEDLITLLITKGVIEKEELHPNIFKNIDIRKGIRLSIQELTDMKKKLSINCSACGVANGKEDKTSI